MKNRCLPILILTATIAFTGCSPKEYREEADDVAYNIIAFKQRQGLGEQEEFTITQVEDTLRKRLLLDQGLPYAGPGALGVQELKPIPHWPDDDYLQVGAGQSDGLMGVVKDEPLMLNLEQCLMIAAASNRDYQRQKEEVFKTALALDLQANEFRTQFSSLWSGDFVADIEQDPNEYGVQGFSSIGFTQLFKNGINVSAALAYDIASLLSSSVGPSQAVQFDASVEIPLMRGSGSWIVTEPLTQAERNALYAVWQFERFKRVFAVDIASTYLNVLRRLNEVENAEANYRRLELAAQRSRALAEAGRLLEIEVDQARQDELQARDNWISAQYSYSDALDSFKIDLGLPTDAQIVLDQDELQELAQEVAGEVAANSPPPDSLPDDTGEGDAIGEEPAYLAPDTLEAPNIENDSLLSLEQTLLIQLALANRLDLHVTEGQVYDAMRRVIVAADSLQAEVTLLGDARTGGQTSIAGAGSDDDLRFWDVGQGVYSFGIVIDLPLERTAERNLYRNSLITLNQNVRSLQAAEDDVKYDIRSGMRNLREAAEGLQIQAKSVTLAAQRVQSTQLFLDAGRAQVRDVLEAQRDLLSAQNALTSAVVNYRVAQLSLQRDTGLLQVQPNGLWKTFVPEEEQIEQMLDLRAPRVIVPVNENYAPVSKRTRELAGGMEQAVEASAGEAFVEPPDNQGVVTPEQDPVLPGAP